MKDKKVLLVIGASSDVGQALIEGVYDNYGTIWAHYNCSENVVNNLIDELGGKIQRIKADLSNVSDVQNMINIITDKNLIPDHIVHLAAPKTFNQKFHKCKWEDYEKGINVSLRSVVMLLETFMPTLIKQNYGKVVFMLTSYVVGVPPKFQSPYITVKYAQLGLMRNLAAEYADKGITVNAVSPEMIETKFLDSIPDLIKEGNAQKMPIGRNLEVSDVVPTFKYLLSDGADIVTGQNIAVTGGVELAK